MKKIILILATLMIFAYFVSPVLALVPISCLGHFGQCSNAGLRQGTCWIACNSNSDCQDGNPLTTNTCRNGGTTSSFCNHNNCPSNTADVNNDPNDRCEVNLLTDTNNCGSVGNVCGACISGTCCNANVGQSCGSCGRGITQCDGSCSGDYSNCGSSGWKNTGSGCGNCGTQQRNCNGCDWTSSYQCVGEGVCSPDSTQCSSNKYQTCTSSCSWSNSGTDSDGDGVDVQCEDSTCDNAAGVCDEAVSGKCIAKTTNEDACTDSLDNDCDSLVDCSDNDCEGSISGNVQNSANEDIDNVRIDVIKGTNPQNFGYTQPSGYYEINEVLCGTYNIIASADGFVSSIKSDVILPPKGSITVDFKDSDADDGAGNFALVSGSTCEDDCTYAGDNIIHRECAGINNCAFYDALAMEVCNLAQPGWNRIYSETEEIECPEGTPTEIAEVQATVTCPEHENLIRITKVVSYRGELVRLVVVTCG